MTSIQTKDLFGVSVVIPTLNSSRTLGDCLSSIRMQEYPQEKIEILVVDGGSTDDTQKIAEAHDCVFIEGGYRENQEARKGVGLHAAKNEIVAYIDSDNILPDKNWFIQMIQPFIEDKEIVGTQTLRYSVVEDFPAFSRYCALLGANDPVAFYLGKSEKLSWVYDEWGLTSKKYETKDFFVVDFTERNLPTVGANGYFIYKDILLKSDCSPENFFHIDVILDLVKMGYTTYAMVKNEIMHDTAATLQNLSKRRVKYFKEYAPTHSNRRYILFDFARFRDIFNLAKFIFFTITLVQPILFSIRGYLKKKDCAWFLHPLVCWNFLIAYTGASLSMFWFGKVSRR